MQQPSIFTRIINGEISSYKIYEDDRVIAFLTNRPLVYGHTLVVPKKQIDQIWDLSHEDYDYLWQITQKIAFHIREVLSSKRVGVVIKGNEVPHAHIHLIPMSNTNAHVNFDPELAPSLVGDEVLGTIAQRLRF